MASGVARTSGNAAKAPATARNLEAPLCAAVMTAFSWLEPSGSRIDLHAVQARGEPRSDALPPPIMCAAQHAAHVHKAVDRAFAAIVLDRHAGGRQPLGVFLALVAQRVVPGRDDQ